MRTLTTNYTTPITTLAFAHDGKTLASADSSGNIQLWDLTTSKTNMTFTSSKKGYIGGLTFSKDNAKLISESNGTIEEWNVTTGKSVNSYTIPEADRNVHTTASHGIGSSKDYVYSWSIGVTLLTTEGGKLASSSWDTKDGQIGSSIKIWDISTGNQLFTITDESSIARALAFTSDEKTLATLGKDITYTLDEKTGKQVADMRTTMIYLWDTFTGKQLAAFDVPKDPVPVKKDNNPVVYVNNSIIAGVVTHDGKVLAAAGSYANNAIFLWDIQAQTHIATLKGHAHIVCRLTISPDDTILASGDAAGDIHLWEIPNGKQIVKFESPGGHISNLTFAPDGKTLASTNGRADGVSTTTREGGIIFLWDIPSK